MGFLQEKQPRRYFAALACLGAALPVFALLLAHMHGRAVEKLIFENESAIVSSLLAQGVPAGTVAAALRGGGVSAAGQTLMQKAGRAAAAPAWLLPEVSRSIAGFLALALSGALLYGAALMVVSAIYLRRRDCLYTAAAHSIARYAEGDFGTRLPCGGNGALYRLFAGIDSLATALAAKGDNERRNRDFLKNTISDISHQLKTPLAALNMYNEIILAEPDNPKTVRDFSAKASQSLSRMEQLIQALLKVTRLDAGSIVFDKKPCRVAELAAGAAQSLATRAQLEGKRLIFEGDEAETLCCDYSWTSEALANLIKNALDHTERGGTVRIGWQRSPAMLRLTVADDGCGIAPEDIHHIFKRFYRSKTHSSGQGVGLGLPLAKAIIEGQGGTLTVSSEAGQGAEFAIAFLTEL